MKRTKCLALACIFAITLITGCGSTVDEAPQQDVTLYENLAKLGRVWGFAKYTHPAFLTGERCWDEELFNLIPIIYSADDGDVNGILYDWFISLGNDGYGEHHIVTVKAQAHVSRMLLLNGIEWLSLIVTSFTDDVMTFLAQMDEENFPRLEEMTKEPTWMFSGLEIIDESEINFRQMADFSWISESYLGPLAEHLLRFNGTIPMERAAAPVFFDPAIGTPNFSNQDLHAHMDFNDTGYRLLGLFRLWNAMKYYFPHLDVLDAEWNDLLLEFIPKMLEGTDRLSYELTLAAMAHHLHDAHVGFVGTTFFADKFGRYIAPVQLISAEGRLVVYEAAGIDNPLARGDVILGVNSRDVDEIIAEMRPFSFYPNEEKALAYLAGRRFGSGFPAGMDIPEFIPLVLRSHVSNMEIDILRNGAEMTFNVNGATTWPEFSPPATQSHVLLDNNIGLINPGVPGDVRSMMESFATTDGIIIDLRQRPTEDLFFGEMRQYLMEEPLPFAYLSSPSQTHPGARVDIPINQYLPQSPYAFVYDRPVVLLMSEQAFSHPEWVIMSFRVAPNVTVIGPYSMGSNGNVALLPLPGDITMAFTSLGVYTPEGGQTHRIGLAPDIRVDRTILGIAEGRDELIEAAVRYIMGERQ